MHLTPANTCLSNAPGSAGLEGLLTSEMELAHYSMMLGVFENGVYWIINNGEDDNQWIYSWPISIVCQTWTNPELGLNDILLDTILYVYIYVYYMYIYNCIIMYIYNITVYKYIHIYTYIYIYRTLSNHIGTLRYMPISLGLEACCLHNHPLYDHCWAS